MFHRFAPLALALCLSISVLGSLPVQAIPVAGDYIFTSGLTGTFTSNGSSLTVWEITAPLGDGYLWTSAPTTPIQDVETNDSDSFHASTHLNGVEYPSNLIIRWGAGDVFANLIFGRDQSGELLEVMMDHEFTVQSVPEGGLEGEVSLGLLIVLPAYVWWRRCQAELWVG